MFKCPSGKNDQGAFQTPGYGYNYQLLGGINVIMATAGNNWQAQQPASLSSLNNTSELVFVTDAVILRSNPITIAYCNALMSYPAVSGLAETNYILPHRHINGQTFTFCDGHAKYYKVGNGPLDPNCKITPGVGAAGNFYWGDYCQYWDPRYYTN